MKCFYLLLLLVVGTTTQAATITYSFETVLDDPFGTLAAGTLLTGEFSFESVQTGVQDPDSSSIRYFDLASLKLSHGSETIELGSEPAAHGWIAVGNFPEEDFFSVRSETVYSEPSPNNPAAFTGTLGGLSVNEFYLAWTDMDASANDNHALPLDESAFLEYETAIAWLVPASYSLPTSYATTTSVSSVAAPVPVPAAAWLFGFGLTALVAMAKNRKA